MKLSVNLSLMYYFIHVELTGLVCSSQTFIFEKLYGLRRANMPRFHLYRLSNEEAYPAQLPTTTVSPFNLRSPFENIYQGSRKPNDTRVYRQRFQYGAKPTGHHVYAKGQFNCIITHLAIETTGGIPILLRGGAGYRYFLAVARAKPGRELMGSVRAYCLKHEDDYYKDHTTPPPSKFF